MEKLWMGLVMFWVSNPELELISVFSLLIYMQKYQWWQKHYIKELKKKNLADLLEIVHVSIVQSSSISRE